MYLLDTNVISELRKRNADTHVVQWAKQQSASQLYLSAISILEIEMGILQLKRKDHRQADLINRWLEQRVLPEFSERILPVDSAVARCCARLHVPNPQSERDALIAATALTHHMAVVTRNTKDFARTNVVLINPWQ